MLLAYFGPEVILPVTSTIAALLGGILMFGKQVSHVARRLTRRLLRRPATRFTRPGPVGPLSASSQIRVDAPAHGPGLPHESRGKRVNA